MSRGERVAVPAISGDEVLAVVELTSREEIELTAPLKRSFTGIGYELGQFLARRRGQLDGQLLTPRELEVLRLGARGLSARETAERLVVSPATVRTHFENIYAKLGGLGQGVRGRHRDPARAYRLVARFVSSVAGCASRRPQTASELPNRDTIRQLPDGRAGSRGR